MTASSTHTHTVWRIVRCSTIHAAIDSIDEWMNKLKKIETDPPQQRQQHLRKQHIVCKSFFPLSGHVLVSHCHYKMHRVPCSTPPLRSKFFISFGFGQENIIIYFTGQKIQTHTRALALSANKNSFSFSCVVCVSSNRVLWCMMLKMKFEFGKGTIAQRMQQKSIEIRSDLNESGS